jgi:hypothetical protein
MKKISFLMFAVFAAVGCGNSSNGNGMPDMAIGGDGDGGSVDMTPPGDLTDTTPLPAPTATHVSATGTTCCMVTSEKSVAYLLNPSPTTGGELHVATSGGTDKMIATGVSIGGYTLSPDGKALFFEGAATADGTLPLSYVDLTAAAPAPKSLFTRGLPGPLNVISFFSPSGHYLLLGVLPVNVSVSPDLHVIDVSKGTDVYQRLNGEFDYIEIMLPDDTLIFQDTVGGMGSPPTNPVQTLYWVALPGTTAATINTRTSNITPSADNKTLVYQRTNGDLYAWSLTSKSGMGTMIASGSTSFTVGVGANGPVAYVGADKSVHVVGFDGTKQLDVAASAANADSFGKIVLAPDNGDVYFWQNVETQDHRGTLMRAQLMTGATPTKVGDKISMPDLNVTDNALVFLQSVDDVGQFGDAATANRDGTGVKPLGMKAAVGGLRVVNPGPDTWFAMHLTGGALDMTNVAIDGTPAITGGLAWADYTGAAELALDATVHQGSFAFSDDGRDAVFVTGAAYDAGSSNWTGSLAFLATRAPSMKIDGKLAGVSELGPISNRTLFVNAPKAAMAGVYYVTY